MSQTLKIDYQNHQSAFIPPGFWAAVTRAAHQRRSWSVGDVRGAVGSSFRPASVHDGTAIVPVKYFGGAAVRVGQLIYARYDVMPPLSTLTGD